jgi:hypothetical protein
MESSEAASALRFHGSSSLPVGLAPFDRLALVVVLLAHCQADRHLRAAVLVVHAHRTFLEEFEVKGAQPMRLTLLYLVFPDMF